MTRFHLLSLRWRLILLVALAIAPSLAMTIAVGIREREHALSSAREHLQRLANLAAANEAQSIEGGMQILRDLSSVPAALAGASECSELMAAILSKNTDFVNFGLVQLDGSVSCTAVPPVAPVNLGDRAHFKRAISERRFIAGNYVFGRVVQKHTINMTYPVIKLNQVRAVLFAAFDLTALDKFVADIQLPAGSVLWTLDEEGTAISRRPDPSHAFGKKMPGSSDLIVATHDHPVLRLDSDQVVRLYASARVGSAGLSGYTVLIGVPEDSILADARRDQQFGLMGLIATLVLAGVAAWWGGQILIVRRVRLLAHTANRIASGSLSTRTGVRYGNEEISELARSLDEMAESLETKDAERNDAQSRLVAADARKDEFLAMLAHELRNPLAPISAGAQFLLHTQAGNEGVTRTAAIISRQVDHMKGLVDDLLDVSRVTRGLIELEYELVDLGAIVEAAAEQIRPLVARKRQQLTMAMPQETCFVLGDRKRLIQILSNMLNNAAKYTQDGGQIKVTLLPEKDRAIMTISDNGIGMTPSLLPQIFDLFSQAERTSDRSQGGLGIGLALVQSLVHLHHGTVRVASAGTGLGSTFFVELPLVQGTAAPRFVDLETQPPTQGLRCLVVDDNSDAAHTLAMFLEATGHRVQVAYSGAEALLVASEFEPQICLLDIGLPDMNGNELVALLRASPITASAVMVAVTGYGRTEDRQASAASGFDHHFVKPLDTAALRALLAATANSVEGDLIVRADVMHTRR